MTQDIQVTTHDLDKRINKFIKIKKKRNNVSNVEEFCDTEARKDASSCARTSTRKIERKQQIKTSRVDNQQGPLAKLQKQTPQKHAGQLPVGVEERLWNLEDHLKLISGPTVNAVSTDVYERIKTCEDRILELEEIAATEDFLEYLNQKQTGTTTKRRRKSSAKGKAKWSR